MPTIRVELQEAPPDPSAWLLYPLSPFNATQTSLGTACAAACEQLDVMATNAQQPGRVVRCQEDSPIVVEYHTDHMATQPVEPLPDRFWTPIQSRHTAPSDQLTEWTREQVTGCGNQREALLRLIDEAGEHFQYDHPEERYNEGHESVPLLCGTAKGSCVDIHGYLLAMAQAVGIPAQYVTGYWFHPDRSYTRDMHCWLAAMPDGKLQFWDIAHHLKWGAPRWTEGLNPAGGRRVLLSHGRGLRFNTPVGEHEISHLAEPVWLLKGGQQVRPKLMITLENE